MKDINIVERFEENWPNLPKDEVRHGPYKGGHLVLVATEHGSLKLLLMAIIGIRGGLSEEMIVIDSAKPIVADRLHLAQNDGFEGQILPLPVMRRAVRQSNDKVGVVCSFMRETHASMKKHPELFFRESTLPRLGLVSLSVGTISGGAWGAGKN